MNIIVVVSSQPDILILNNADESIMNRSVMLVRCASSADAPLVVLNCFGDEGEAVAQELDKQVDHQYSLLAITVSEWNIDLSPWKAPAVFKGEPDFGCGANKYISELVNDIVPSVCSSNCLNPRAIYIAGYSMAGLFALYSLYKTDRFAGAASCSGSLWFPGFSEYVHEHEFTSATSKIYLSLGDREAKTKNPVMATVEDNTRNIAELYSSQGYNMLFEMNQGGHFNDHALRTAKGIAWMLK